jgi:hypothetical protein
VSLADEVVDQLDRGVQPFDRAAGGVGELGEPVLVRAREGVDGVEQDLVRTRERARLRLTDQPQRRRRE